MTIFSVEQTDNLAQSLYSQFFSNIEVIPVSSIQSEYETELETLLDSDEPLDIDSYARFEQLIAEYELTEKIQEINAWHTPKNQELSFNV